MPGRINRDGVTQMLPICNVCNQRMTRSGRALAELRADPHCFDGWTHRQCRNGQPRPQPQPRVTQPRPQPIIRPTEFNSINITLDKTQKSEKINIKDYENMLIGIEIETNLDTATAKRVTGFTGEIGKTDGRGRKKAVVESGNVKVEYQQEIDLYKEEGLISQIYNDGSIGAEIVLRPLPLNKWHMVEEIHKKLKNAGADFFSNGAGGFHMTFILDHHKNLSRFDKIATKNIMQFARMFYWDIIKAFGYGGKTRGTGYRCLPALSCTTELSTSHPTAINLRKTGSERGSEVWGIEVRFPDGCSDFNHVLKQAKFWSAIFRKSAKISKAGLMNFPQSTWDAIRTHNPERINERSNVLVAHNILNPQLEEIIKEDLIFFGYYDRPQTQEEIRAEQEQIDRSLKNEVA